MNTYNADVPTRDIIMMLWSLRVLIHIQYQIILTENKTKKKMLVNQKLFKNSLYMA